MIKKRVSGVVDRALLFLVMVFFSIAIAGYFSRDSFIIIVAGITAALSITALIGFKKNKKAGIAANSVKEVMLQFYLNPKAFTQDTIFNALASRYTVTKSDDFIMVKRVAIYPYLYPKSLNFVDFCQIFSTRPKSANRLILLTARGQESEVKEAIAALDLKINIDILHADEVYTLLEKLNGLPPIQYTAVKKRRGISTFFTAALQPINAKRYLLTAALLIGSSFFMPSSIHYIIIAAICITLAVLCKTLKITNH